jgi:hypothetical protein
MPVHWQVDHATWTVVVTAEGTLGLKDFEGLLDSMARAATLSYRKLFDMTRISSALSKEDLVALRSRIARESDLGPRGPAAIVAATDEHYEHAHLFQAMMAESLAHQRVSVFRELQAASDWLSAEPVETKLHGWLENDGAEMA